MYFSFIYLLFFSLASLIMVVPSSASEHSFHVCGDSVLHADVKTGYVLLNGQKLDSL